MKRNDKIIINVIWKENKTHLWIQNPFWKKKRQDPGFFVSLVIYVNIVYIMKDAHALSYYKFDETYFTYYLKQMYS